MEAHTNPASWPWFQLMSDALEGRLVGKAPKVAPVWTSEEDGVFGLSPPRDRDGLMAADRSSVSELESMVGGDSGEADENVTYIDASGEECSTPSEFSYKSKTESERGSGCAAGGSVGGSDDPRLPFMLVSVGSGHQEDDQAPSC